MKEFKIDLKKLESILDPEFDEVLVTHIGHRNTGSIDFEVEFDSADRSSYTSYTMYITYEYGVREHIPELDFRDWLTIKVEITEDKSYYTHTIYKKLIDPKDKQQVKILAMLDKCIEAHNKKMKKIHEDLVECLGK